MIKKIYICDTCGKEYEQFEGSEGLDGKITCADCLGDRKEQGTRGT